MLHHYKSVTIVMNIFFVHLHTFYMALSQDVDTPSMQGLCRRIVHCFIASKEINGAHPTYPQDGFAQLPRGVSRAASASLTSQADASIVGEYDKLLLSQKICCCGADVHSKKKASRASNLRRAEAFGCWRGTEGKIVSGRAMAHG
jgi:hypothetical protein